MPIRTYIYILTGLLLVSGFLLMLSKEGHAANRKSKVECDTTQNVAIRFSFRLNEVDSSYGGNWKAIAWLDSQLVDSAKASRVETVKIASYVLPQGNAAFENWLASMRASTVNSYLRERYPRLDKEAIRSARVNDSVKIEQAKSADRDLNRVDIELIRHCPVVPEAAIAQVEETAAAVEEVVPPVNAEPIFVDEPRVNMEKEEQQQAVATEVRPAEQRTVLAVKNNLLYDLALAPNLEVELPIGKQWSVNTEYKCPWWLNSTGDFCYQLLSGGIEARYWLGKRRNDNRLTGHFVGLYGEGGVYDFQLRGDGYQGKYYAASGVSYGYVKPIARHLALEFSLGVGYLTTEYRKYTPYKGDLIWKSSGRYNFIGPTKAKVSLVWLIKTRR